MKSIVLANTLALGLFFGAEANARPVTIDLTMADYSGNPAFLVAYVVDEKGLYASTLYAAGSNGRYFEHLDRWYRMFMRNRGNVDGTTGASMGAGGHANFTVEVPDKLLNAGFTLRIESAVESQYYVADEAATPLDDAHNGVAVNGTRYLSTLTVSY